MRRGDLSHTHCVRPDCGREMVGSFVWRQWTLEQRAQARAEGKVRHHGKGLCATCYSRAARQLDTPVTPDGTRRSADVLEDWQDLAYARAGMSQRQAIRHLAPRMGMTPAALEKALLRAKRAEAVAA